MYNCIKTALDLKFLSSCSPDVFIQEVVQNPLLFKSFTGLTIQKFDNIFDKEITKRYDKHEMLRLSKRKEDRARKAGAVGRPFKLDLENRFLMLLVYYRLYITYTLAGFLFNLDQSTIYRDIQKIDELIRKCLPIPQKTYYKTEATNSIGSREILSWISCLY